MKKIKELLPALGLVVASVAGALAAVLTDNQITTPELLGLTLLVLAGFTTYIVPRVEGVTWLKPAIAAAFAGVEALGAVLSDGISGSEWVLVGAAVVGAVNVAVTNRLVPITVSP